MEDIKKAISNQFVSNARRDFVDREKGKHVHFSPFPGNVLSTGVTVVSNIDVFSSPKNSQYRYRKRKFN